MISTSYLDWKSFSPAFNAPFRPDSLVSESKHRMSLSTCVRSNASKRPSVKALGSEYCDGIGESTVNHRQSIDYAFNQKDLFRISAGIQVPQGRGSRRVRGLGDKYAEACAPGREPGHTTTRSGRAAGSGLSVGLRRASSPSRNRDRPASRSIRGVPADTWAEETRLAPLL